MVRTPITVLLVHPKSFAAELLVRALSRVPHYRVLELVTAYSDLAPVLQDSAVDVMLISHKMLQSSPDGLGAIKAVRSEYHDVKPVFLLEDRTPHVVIESFRSGAKGVFCITAGEFDSLCRCVEFVHAGGIWASEQELKWMMGAIRSSATQRIRGDIIDSDRSRLLSTRERTVARLVLDGLPNSEIASQLKLTEQSFSKSVSRIFKKVGMPARNALIPYPKQNSLEPRKPSAPALKPTPILTLPRHGIAGVSRVDGAHQL